MSYRPGGMMIWGIPAFRCPGHVIEEDMKRLFAKCPGITLHLNTALGRDITIDELKERHDAVLLTIGPWWGKRMNIPGEDDPRGVNGGGWEALLDAGVEVGGGDVVRHRGRAAIRMHGCSDGKVGERRGPEGLAAGRHALEDAHEEGIELSYKTPRLEVAP